MHPSVMQFLASALAPEDVAGKTVLEVGSMDLNGSPRSVVLPMRPLQYLGVDSGAGPGVDMVAPAEELTDRVGAFSWDLVISTEMLEHAEHWRTVVQELKQAVAPHGVLLVTCRGPGFPYHAHPGDFWRFTTDDFRRIFADFELEILQDDTDPAFPGVFMKARKTRARYQIDLAPIEVAPVVRPTHLAESA